MKFDRKGYWENKILGWEQARYGGNPWLRPGSWTLRRRLEQAAGLAKRALPPGGRVLDLGCGSGLLASRLHGHYGSYHGVDLAEGAIRAARGRSPGAEAVFEQGDVLRCPLPAADLTIFLGLLDWLEPEEIPAFFARLTSPLLIFSFTERSRIGRLNPYGLYRAYYDSRFGRGIYRARSYDAGELAAWLAALRPEAVEVQPHLFFDPGRLVLVRREARL